METKKCSKCGDVKGVEEFRKERNQCKECVSEDKRKWYAANSEKAREKAKQWYAANSEKAREKAKQWYAANPEKANERVRKWNQKSRDTVCDSYIVAYLARDSPLRVADVRQYPELIEAKRLQILIHRELKTLNT